MNNYKDYSSARKQLADDIKKELLGGSGYGDLVIDNPVKRYSIGMIFPLGYADRNKETIEETEAADNAAEGETKPIAQTPDPEEGSDIEQASALANSFFPSVVGISFYTKGVEPLFKVIASYSTYQKISWEEIYAPIRELPPQLINLQEFKENFEYKDNKIFALKKLPKDNIDIRIRDAIEDSVLKQEVYTALHQIKLGHNNGAWRRVPKTFELKIEKAFTKKIIDEGLELIINRRNKNDNVTLFTVCLKNTFQDTSDDKVFFQISLRAEALSDRNIFLEYSTLSNEINDKEEKALAFLYRHKKTYAVGHGCAAVWENRETGNGVKAVLTEAIPLYELPAIDFSIPGLSPKEEEDIFSMKKLGGLEGSDGEIITKLKKFSKIYETWINGLKARKDIPDEFTNEAQNNILLCKEVLDRINNGILLLQKDKLAIESFKLANKAMLMQSLHADLQKNRVNISGKDFEWPNLNKVPAGIKKWRPFQLGFLLLSLDGISNPESKDRNIVDLIWFPTGGGKTEAYLALTAYTIFYRRLNHGPKGGGTTVMMRYTLRLLTAQQFQRACTLICAMEKIRTEDSKKRLGAEEISIGLWVGSHSTPNKFVDAERDLANFRRTGRNLPSPLLMCPWCGTDMVIRQAGMNDYAIKYKTRPKRMQLYCKEKKCFFNERLPIMIVDEEIYETPPTLLFGTVDKFAQMPNRRGVASIFGIGDILTPELIIQDELHLISGSLGTMVALYETVIDFLCSKKGRIPKMIASTATIRRAKEQCLGLFAREAKQFPASGLEIEDSFFTKEAPRSKPGRMYVGIMGAGKTQTTVAVRLAAALLTSVQELKFTDNVKDNYWTLVGYFNSIRELGGFISLIQDDVALYVNTLRERYGVRLRSLSNPRELTSRKDAEEIPRILGELSIPYPEKGSVDVVAATNMISVGVDIDRLGLMIVRGQPKLTSEYIQVTSRIGRKFPGLVAILYNSARTRDRAHYERFMTYHGSFYRYVEPSSITPFSLPARTRAFRAVIVAMIRHGVNGLSGEKDVVLFKKDMPEVNEVKEFILSRIRKIDPAEEDDARIELDQVFTDWKDFAETQHEHGVYSNTQSGNPLLAPPGSKNQGLWEAPTSMRNVDQECAIYIEDE